MINAQPGYGNLYAFASAQYNAENHGITVTAFVTHPDDALLLAQLKDEKTSNRPLLGIDASQPGRRTVFGVPLRTCRAVEPGTVWAIPQEMIYAVLGRLERLDISTDVMFNNDMIALRAVTEVGFAFVYPHHHRVLKLTQHAR
ncbi:phage major capsid protein [Streptomyces sp. NPDC048506]|uniref:phage major capsid family protein n=1 Tax=Streptomyces sp. NPDC048506 TaxID=3155028 RepID=UPI003426706A